MKAIVLAAGTGSRLAPHTASLPKAMIPLRGRPILDYTLGNLVAAGIHDIAIVTGYKADAVAFPALPIRYFHNPRFMDTNMIHSLFCAEPHMDDETVVSYGDIVYEPRVLRALLESPADVAVVVDDLWLDLWTARAEDPLLDAETLKMDVDGSITEIGARPSGFGHIDSQYIGLMKFSVAGLDLLKSEFRRIQGADKEKPYMRGRTPEELYLTDMLQLLADAHPGTVKAVRIRGGWVEIDTTSDYQLFEDEAGPGERFCDFGSIPAP